MLTWHIRHITCTHPHTWHVGVRCVCTQGEGSGMLMWGIPTLSCRHCTFAHTILPPAQRVTGSSVGTTLSPCCLFFGVRVTRCPLTPDPWPHDLSPSAGRHQCRADSSQSPLTHKSEEMARERGRGRELGPPTSPREGGAGSVHLARVTVHLFGEVTERERNTVLIYEIWRAKLEEMKIKGGAEEVWGLRWGLRGWGIGWEDKHGWTWWVEVTLCLRRQVPPD